MNAHYRILLRKLQPILVSISEAAHGRFSSTCAETQKAFQDWQASHLYLPTDPLYEFCLQTAFIQFVRAYVLRICEEYRLFPPFPAGELESKSWLISSMETTLHILKHLDYGTSASIAQCFDWFAPDEQSMLQLYHLLKPYNFKALAGDMLGKVYNESFIEQRNRSDDGQ